MTEQAAMTASKLMTLSTRIVLRMTYPGPARDFPKQPIFIVGDVKEDEVADRMVEVECKIGWVVGYKGKVLSRIGLRG